MGLKKFHNPIILGYRYTYNSKEGGEIMDEVKISYNKQTWDDDGYYYRGCFTLNRDTYERFVGEENTTNNVHFLTITGRNYLVEWLREQGIPFNINRAFGAGNYYINIVN